MPTTQEQKTHQSPETIPITELITATPVTDGVCFCSEFRLVARPLDIKILHKAIAHHVGIRVKAFMAIPPIVNGYSVIDGLFCDPEISARQLTNFFETQTVKPFNTPDTEFRVRVQMQYIFYKDKFPEQNYYMGIEPMNFDFPWLAPLYKIPIAYSPKFSFGAGKLKNKHRISECSCFLLPLGEEVHYLSFQFDQNNKVISKQPLLSASKEEIISHYKKFCIQVLNPMLEKGYYHWFDSFGQHSTLHRLTKKEVDEISKKHTDQLVQYVEILLTDFRSRKKDPEKFATNYLGIIVSAPDTEKGSEYMGIEFVSLEKDDEESPLTALTLGNSYETLNNKAEVKLLSSYN